jgi:hypothetical protein
MAGPARKIAWLGLSVMAVAALGSCGSSSNSAKSSTTTTAVAGAGATAGGTGQTTTPSTSARFCPAPTGNFTSTACYASGTAHVEESGGLTGTLDLPLNAANAIAYFPNGVLSLGYVNQQDTLVISTDAKAGQASTTTVRLVHGSTYYDSSGTQCKINVTRADKTGATGTFTCTGLQSGGGPTVNATGTFSASA